MTDAVREADDGATAGVEPGAYCRQVEDHLTRANGGHLVRIVGPGFDVVRQWARDGIPLSIVFRGIDSKVDRHQAAGRSHRPLRIEFCEADVRQVYDGWQRAVGLFDRQEPEAADEVPVTTRARRRPSLSKHLDRAIDRLSLATGRLDLPETVRDALGMWLQELVDLRDAAKKARGPARDELAARLGPLDQRLAAAVRVAASPALKEELEREAEHDLGPFRDRLSGEAWQRAVDVTVDRLLRDRFRLPGLAAEVGSREGEVP